jgi:hypothetical protein
VCFLKKIHGMCKHFNCNFLIYFFENVYSLCVWAMQNFLCLLFLALVITMLLIHVLFWLFIYRSKLNHFKKEENWYDRGMMTNCDFCMIFLWSYMCHLLWPWMSFILHRKNYRQLNFGWSSGGVPCGVKVLKIPLHIMVHVKSHQ